MRAGSTSCIQLIVSIEICAVNKQAPRPRKVHAPLTTLSVIERVAVSGQLLWREFVCLLHGRRRRPSSEPESETAGDGPS